MISNEYPTIKNNLSINTNNVNTIINFNNSIEYNNRTTNIGMDSLSNDSKMEIEMEKNKNDSINNINTNINIFRYKFTQEFMDELYKFSKIHQYDHRKDFKEAWKIWTEENDELISHEIRRLENLSYDGDVLDKMFKSARYYYRKKSTEKKAPKQRRVYMGLQKDLLEAMDEHINIYISDKSIKPSIGFENFCKENIDILKIEINRLLKNGISDPEEIKNKIKKTYKNRYFMIISK